MADTEQAPAPDNEGRGTGLLVFIVVASASAVVGSLAHSYAVAALVFVGVLYATMTVVMATNNIVNALDRLTAVLAQGASAASNVYINAAGSERPSGTHVAPSRPSNVTSLRRDDGDDES